MKKKPFLKWQIVHFASMLISSAQCASSLHTMCGWNLFKHCWEIRWKNTKIQKKTPRYLNLIRWKGFTQTKKNRYLWNNKRILSFFYDCNKIEIAELYLIILPSFFRVNAINKLLNIIALSSIRFTFFPSKDRERVREKNESLYFFTIPFHFQ